MEQEGAINFHSLRAKFQESQTKDRPPVPERPKRLPATVGRSGTQFALLKPTLTSMEDKTTICSKNTVRDDKISISQPVNTFQTTTIHATGSTTNHISKVPFKDLHLPLVLPIPFSSEHHSLSPPKGVSSPIRGKKKNMIMPFKTTIASKFGKGNLEYGEHTSSLGKSKIENGLSYNGDSSNPGSLNPSPEKPGTPPPVDGIEGSSTDGCTSQTSHQRVLSTLERAKRKFSPKQLLEYAKPKSFHSRNSSPSTSPPPPPADYENMTIEYHLPGGTPPPVPLHAPPSPLKSNGKYATVNRDKGCVLVQPNLAPPINLLPDLQSLGSRPMKPPRPPLVDLAPFSITNEFEQTTVTARVYATSEDVNLEQHVLDAPELPDFASSEPVYSTNSAFDMDIANVNVASVSTETFREVELPPPNPLGFGCGDSRDPSSIEQVAPPVPPALPPWVDSQPCVENGTDEILDCELRGNQATGSFVTSEAAVDQNVSKVDDHGDNIYEDVATVGKFYFNQNSRKRKGAPKNPYASPPLNELTRKTGRTIAPWSKETGERVTLTHRHSVKKERGSPDSQEQKEQKEQKKKEKQNQEKEKKEQKERQKRENEMKKKFKVTGLEEPMYHAKVMVTSKVRKHDLQVKCGDTVSIIRTTNCPKGKWLARDVTHIYGYVSLKNLELNIKEMLELGKRASQTSGLASNEGDTVSLGSSTQNPTHTSSFTDDSEEWTFDEETLSPSNDMSQCQSMSMLDMYGNGTDGNMHQTQLDAVDNVTTQTSRDALQKLAIFFQQSKGSFDDPADNGEATPTNAEDRDFLCGIEEHPYIEQQGEDFEFADVELLPPPELYADT